MVTLMAYTVGSISMAIAAVWSAWSSHHQFYLAAQQLTASKLSIVVLMNCALCFMILFGQFLKWAFLTKLRDLEVEHLYEKLAYTVSESLLVIAMFRTELSSDILLMLTIMLFLKIFHWIVSDRVDFVPQAPSITVYTLIRLYSLMGFLLLCDVILLYFAVSSVLSTGFSMMILFGFEFIVLTVTMISFYWKLSLHIYDLYVMDGAWERKSALIFYVELLTDVINLMTYLFFFAAIMTYMGIPIHIIRDIYMTFRNLQRRINDLIRYRRATAGMDERYPDATQEELDALTDRTCIICRDEMANGKKLPCGHIFHLQCLRSWLERQQTCPICRTDVLTAHDANANENNNGNNNNNNNNEGQAPAAAVNSDATDTSTSTAAANEGGESSGGSSGSGGSSVSVQPAFQYGSNTGNTTTLPLPMPMPASFPMFQQPSPTPSPSLSLPGSSLPPVNVMLDRTVPISVLERLADETTARLALIQAELDVVNTVLEARRVKEKEREQRRAKREKDRERERAQRSLERKKQREDQEQAGNSSNSNSEVLDAENLD